MKKIFYFASLMLALFTMTSCTEKKDNPVVPPTPEKTTTTITLDGVNYEADVVATFKGEVGQEVSLTLGVYDAFDIYGVDFGDGQIKTDTVCYQNGGLKDAEGMTKEDSNHKVATIFNGTVAGEGNIIVYGVNKSDIWYLKVEGNAMPTSLDQEKLLKVVQASFSGANVESVELPAMEALTQFSFTNSPVKSIDISKATALTRIDIYNTTQSAFEPQLTQIDLSKNTELEAVVLGGSTYKKGELTSLDFTNNTKLTQISAENNKLTSVTGIAPTVKNIYLGSNELESITLPEFTVTKGNFQIQNNKFTLATLPVKPASCTASKYKYAPQPAYQVAEAITDQNNLLDLSSQLTATGVASEPQITTYTFLAGTTTLTEGEDYSVVEPGKFTFLKSQTEKVHVEMATEAFPNFKNSNAYVTTEFTVNVSAAAEAATIFTATPIAAWDAPESAETEITSDLATITGGKLFAINQQTAAKAMIKNQGGELAFQCTNNNTFFKIVLDKALQAGDVISIRMQSRTDTDLGLFFAASDSRPSETATSIILPTAEAQAWVDAPTYTVKSDDGICGQTTFYAFRATGKSTYFNTFTITRGK